MREAVSASKRAASELIRVLISESDIGVGELMVNDFEGGRWGWRRTGGGVCMWM